MNPSMVGVAGSNSVPAQVYRQAPVGMVDEFEGAKGAEDEVDGSNENCEDTTNTQETFDGPYPEVWMAQVKDPANVNPPHIAPDQAQSEESDMSL